MIFKRNLRLVIDGETQTPLNVEHLKIAFNVQKITSSVSNKAQISVYNLKESTRQIIKERGQYVLLEGGYNDEYNTLFAGDIYNIFHRREESDIITEIYASTADLVSKKTVVNKTFPKDRNTPLDQVLFLVDEMVAIDHKLAIDVIEGIDGLDGNSRAVTMNGNARYEMDKIARNYGLEWSINDNRFVMIKSGEPLKRTTTISSQNGMVGNAIVTETGGVMFSSLLNPNLNPMEKVKVLSDFADVNMAGLENTKRDTDLGGGEFEMVNVTHIGDNRDGKFLTVVEATRLL